MLPEDVFRIINKKRIGTFYFILENLTESYFQVRKGIVVK